MLKSIHHTAIICSDYETSKAFYVDKLGLEIIAETYREDRDSYKLDLALNGRYIIELFSFPNPPERVTRPEAAGLRLLQWTILTKPSASWAKKAFRLNRSAQIPVPENGSRFSPIPTACLWNCMKPSTFRGNP